MAFLICVHSPRWTMGHVALARLPADLMAVVARLETKKAYKSVLDKLL